MLRHFLLLSHHHRTPSSARCYRMSSTEIVGESGKSNNKDKKKEKPQYNPPGTRAKKRKRARPEYDGGPIKQETVAALPGTSLSCCILGFYLLHEMNQMKEWWLNDANGFINIHCCVLWWDAWKWMIIKNTHRWMGKCKSRHSAPSWVHGLF